MLLSITYRWWGACSACWRWSSACTQAFRTQFQRSRTRPRRRC